MQGHRRLRDIAAKKERKHRNLSCDDDLLATFGIGLLDYLGLLQIGSPVRFGSCWSYGSDLLRFMSVRFVRFDSVHADTAISLEPHDAGVIPNM